VDDKMMPLKPGAINGGLMKRPHPGHVLTNYIDVPSIEKSLEKIEASGGTIMMGKTPIGSDMGWIALFKDTEGNLMGLHQMPENW
jgi:predicted enzyme related to lactoylglutathione lyase